MTILNFQPNGIKTVSFGAKGPKFKPSAELSGDTNGSALKRLFNVPNPSGDYLIDDNNVFRITAEKAATWNTVWDQKLLGQNVRRPAVDFLTQGVVGVILPENWAIQEIRYNEKRERIEVKPARVRFAMVATGETPWHLAVVDKKYLKNPPVVVR